MFAWLARIFVRRPPDAPKALVAHSVPAPIVDAPSTAAPVLETVQKSARAVAKLGLRFEQLESKVEAGFADLRAQLSRVRNSSSDPRLPFEILFDVADLLDEASRHAPSADHADGLSGICDRVEKFLREAGLNRVSQVGPELDARIFRVVGSSNSGDGIRVVRAAIVDGERLVREGEVLIDTPGDDEPANRNDEPISQ